MQTELQVKKTSFEINSCNQNMRNFPTKVNKVNLTRLQTKNEFSNLDTIKSSQENENIILNSPKSNIKNQNKTQLTRRIAPKRNKKQVEHLTPKVYKNCCFFIYLNNAN